MTARSIDDAMLASRAVHLAACLLLVGMDAFGILILPAALRSTRCRRQRTLSTCVLALLIISGATWLVLVTGAMTEWPLTSPNLWLVWTRTHFGKLWQLRTMLVVALIACRLIPRKVGTSVASLLFTGALLTSLAWAGHAQLSAHANVHLLIDAVHLLAASFWPTMLVPLAIALADRSLEDHDAIIMLDRFSRMSVCCVVTIICSGVMNACLTLDPVSDLWQTRYGTVLIAKVAIVATMIGIGAMNRRSIRRSQILQIRRRIGAEVVLAMLVIAATAWLGTLEP